jgi:hypothetical protein
MPKYFILSKIPIFFVNLALKNKRLCYVGSRNERLSTHIDGGAGRERMAQIMREVAEDARESTRRAAERVAASIEAATHEARARVEETLNRLRNGCN